MLSEDCTFVEAVLQGDAQLGDLDDWLDDWHSGADTRPLNECLGFTADEYALWVEQPNVVFLLLQCRKYHITLQDAVDIYEGYLLAFRTSPQEDMERMIEYLRRTGRIV